MATLVRTLSSVDASMTSETRGLFNQLEVKMLGAYAVTYVREAFATTNVLALVRLLAGVCPNMNSQSTSLDEALPTSWGRTRVGTLIGVDSIMPL